MPNPRYLSKEGIPTPELLEKLHTAKLAYFGSLPLFNQKWGTDKSGLEKIVKVCVIGSHANDQGWKDETSDLDLKLVTPEMDAELVRDFKNNFLRRLLCQGEKRHWIDLFFVHEEYQVTPPRFDVTEYWDKIDISKH